MTAGFKSALAEQPPPHNLGAHIEEIIFFLVLDVFPASLCSISSFSSLLCLLYSVHSMFCKCFMCLSMYVRLTHIIKLLTYLFTVHRYTVQLNGVMFAE